MILKSDKLKQQKDAEVEQKPDPSQLSREEDFVVIEEDTEEAKEKAATDLKQDISVVKGVMGDFDLKILEDEEKEIDQLIGDIDMQNDSEQVPNSFSKIRIEDFPLFLTVKELLYLLDSLVPDSFFLRTPDRTIKSGFDEDGRKILYRHRQNIAENRIQDGILGRDNFNFNRKLHPDIDSSDEESEENKKNDFEANELTIAPTDADLQEEPVDFDLTLSNVQGLIEIGYSEFKDIFWEGFLKALPWTARDKWRKTAPRMAWLYLMSTTPARPELTDAYEKWKKKNGFFDLLDLKAFLNTKRVISQAKRYLVNFMFIDEIQDIPRPLINFLCRFSSNNVYLSGDNAQNINKSSVMSFKQLAKTIECRFQYFSSGAAYYQLSINYRSHQQILNLANNIIYHLKLFFPYEVEDLPPEESKQDGPKPVILPLGTTREQLKDFIRTRMNNSEMSGLTRFGGRQVIITREYETKEEAERLFPESLVFTIREAKGMEFDDVVLFNYFSDSESRLSWNAFRDCLFISKTEAKRYSPIHFTENSVTYCMERQTDMECYTQVTVEKNKKEYAVWVEKNRENQVAEAADELKLLYVAVTRAKTRLVIYDDLEKVSADKHHRSYFEGVWRELKLVEDASSSMSLDAFDRAGTHKSQEQQQKKLMADALEFMKKGQYSFAEKCFRLAQCPRGEAVATLHKEAKRLKLNHFSACTSKSSPDAKQTLEEYKQTLKEEGRQISERFLQIGKPDWALQTLTITGDSAGQISLLQKLQRRDGLAEIYFGVGRIQEAFHEFVSVGNFEGAYGCLLGLKDPHLVLEYVLDLLPSIDDARMAKKLRKISRLQLFLIGQTINSNIVSEQPAEAGNNDSGLKEDHQSVSSFVDVREEDEMAEFQDVIDRMSDSFIKISVAGDGIDVVDSSLEGFHKVASEHSMHHSFIEVVDDGADVLGRLSFEHQQQVSKIISLWSRISPVFEDKPASDEAARKEVKIIEIGMVELEERLLLDLIERFEKIDCLGLAALIKVAAGLATSYLPLFAAKLQGFSQLKSLFCKTEPETFDSLLNIRDAHERRWLNNLGFLTIRKQFNQQQLRKDLADKRSLAVRSAHVLIGLYGFSKQVSSLYSPTDLSKVLNAFGDIESLLTLRTDLVAGKDRQVLYRLLTDTPSEKLSTVYSTFGCRFVRKCALLNFSIYWLMSKKTYVAADGLPMQFGGKNAHLRLLFDLAAMAAAGEGEQLHNRMLKIPVFDWMKKNVLEQGFLLGFLYNLFHYRNDIVHPTLQSNERAMFKLKRRLKYLPFFVSSFLLPHRDKFAAGFYLAFKVSVLPVDLDLLAAHRPHPIFRGASLHPVRRSHYHTSTEASDQHEQVQTRLRQIPVFSGREKCDRKEVQDALAGRRAEHEAADQAEERA